MDSVKQRYMRYAGARDVQGIAHRFAVQPQLQRPVPDLCDHVHALELLAIRQNHLVHLLLPAQGQNLLAPADSQRSAMRSLHRFNLQLRESSLGLLLSAAVSGIPRPTGLHAAIEAAMQGMLALPNSGKLMLPNMCSSSNGAWRSPLQVQRRDGLVGDDQCAAAAHVLLQQLCLIQQPGADVDGVRPVTQVHVHLR
jgi:hypothetical protein